MGWFWVISSEIEKPFGEHLCWCELVEAISCKHVTYYKLRVRDVTGCVCMVQALCITWCGFSELLLSGSFPMILTCQPQCDWLLGSRLCANRDRGINPSGHTPPIRSPVVFFQRHPGLHLCHKPFRGWDIISAVNLFLRSLGCHCPILPPELHPVRFRGWGLPSATDG